MARAAKKDNGKVTVELPRGSKEGKYVAVNGVAYIIPKRGEVDVPPEIAEELARSQRAEDDRDRNDEGMRSKA